MASQTLRRFVIAASLVAQCSWPVCTAHAASFVVDSPASFQTALNNAAANGESDVITVLAGSYPITSTLSLDSSESYTLTISGSGTSTTTLDGGGLVQVLFLRSTGSGGAVVIEDLTISNGLSASENGGGILVETGAAAVSMSNCEVTDSEVSGDLTVGGGAALVSDTGNVNVTGSAFRRNHSAANVGGLFASTGDGVITVTSCTFVTNTVNNTGSSTYFGDGGGAMLYTDANGEIMVNACNFTNNSVEGGANGDGGGLMTYQLGAGVSSVVTNSTFSSNQASLGAGGLTQRINDAGSITCTGNTIINNSTGAGDGAGAFLYFNTGPLVVSNNTFTDNDSAWDGGGLWIFHTAGSDTITGNVFVGNTANNNGAGLTLSTDTAVSTVTGNQFRGNSAVGVGGGLSYATGTGSLLLRANSFYGNAGSDGGGMYIYVDNDAGSLDVRDLILWNDTPNEVGFSSNTGLDTLTVRYSDIAGGGADPWFGTGCIDADPLFVNAAGGDLRLSWVNYPVPDATMSPCIDTGDPASPDDPDDTRADMGALPYDQGGSIFEDGFESGNTSAWTVTVP